MDVANYWFSSGATGGYEIANSLRFRGAQTLSWTPTLDRTDSQKYTISFWVKRGGLGANGGGVAQARVSSSAYEQLGFAPTSSIDSLRTNRVSGGTSVSNIYTLAVYRDPSAWMHVVYSYDSTQATPKDRGKFFVNGVFVPHDENNNIDSGQNSGFGNPSAVQTWGRTQGFNDTWFDGYLAEVHVLDGTAVSDASDFGEFDGSDVWVPKEVTGVTYGNNGYYLDFSDPADIGADRSGNGNNFTPTNFELTDSSNRNYDWAVDSPTDNIGSINTVVPASYTDSGGTFYLQHATTTSTSTWRQRWRPLAVQLPKTGKYFVTAAGTFETEEAYARRLTGLYILDDQDFTFNANNVPANGTGLTVGESAYARYIRWAVNGTIGADFARPSNFRNHTLCLAYDADTRKVWIGWADQNAGTTINWIDSSGGLTGDPAAGTNETGTVSAGVIKPTVMIQAAIQQAGTAGNANAYGRVSDPTALWQNRGLTAPAGFEPLSTATMPAVAITNPSDYFTTILDTGANILTNAQATFPNGLWWIKDRANANQHQLVDSVSGTSSVRQCPANTNAAYTAPTGNSVAWCWATPASGINTTAGFSITSGTHGLGVTPACVIDRELRVWHQSLPAGQVIRLFNDLATTAETWTVDGTTVSSPGGGPYWAWAEIPGYSSFGSYVGNGNVDGPFIYTGFSVGFVLIKKTSPGGTSWYIYDSVRNPYNLTDINLKPNSTAAESVTTQHPIDILSNGFKVRNNAIHLNDSGQTHIYMAFAEHPNGGANVSPSPAR